MLALADQFPEWTDFPKGLHVMLVDQDPDVIEDVRCKLSSCGYLVTCYKRGEEALKELEERSKSFHVVVVDATRSDAFDGFQIVAAAKHLTTIMMASTENMNIMMQGIAAGASEFLQKPLSEERLKNIWQHVVRKALVTGHLSAPTSVRHSANDVNSNVPSAQLSFCTEEDDELPNCVKQEAEACCKPSNICTDGADDMPSVHQFFFQGEKHHQHNDSSYFLGMDGRDNCDAFLCSTPPQLEQSCTRLVCMEHEDNVEHVSSPALSGSQDLEVACMKRELNDIEQCFHDCDNYLHIKSEVEEAVNNSAILNELFDSKKKRVSDDYLLMSGGDPNTTNAEFGDPKLCALQFDDIPDGLDDIALDEDILDDGTDQSLSMGLDCLDDEEFQEADEEALLLAEVAEVEKAMLSDTHCNAVSSHNYSSSNGNRALRLSKSTSSRDCSDGSRFETHEEVRSKSDSEQSCNAKCSKMSSGKKKMKVDWTPELHRRFVQAVEQLGVDKAIPSRILELMGVKCLTRHNIASHLQKYRSHRKHVLAREAEAASWNQRRQMEAAAAASRAVAPPPANHHHHQTHATWQAPRVVPQMQPRTALPAPALHVWGHPTLDPAMHFWPAWCPPGYQMDAWGNPFYPAQPILRVPLAPMPSIANMALPLACGKLANLHPAKETVVAAINEVLRNPYIPLPLGLKPPSLESVASELLRQGISPTATV